MQPTQAIREQQAGIGEQFARSQVRDQRAQRSQIETYPQLANRITNAGMVLYTGVSNFINPSYDFNDCLGMVAFSRVALRSNKSINYRSKFTHNSNIFLNAVLLSSNCYNLVSGKASYYEIFSTAQCIANIVNETYILSKTR